MICYTDKHKLPFLIDDDDWEAVSHYPWSIDSDDYPKTQTGKMYGRFNKGRGRIRTVHLHVFLLGRAPKGYTWDHENRDKRDNRRSNLRLVTLAQNHLNTSSKSRNKTGVKGVYPSGDGRYRALIKLRGKQHYLGTFTTVEEAAAARAAVEEKAWAMSGGAH